MPAIPQILKTIELQLDGQDFDADVIAAAIVPSAGAIRKVTTLDGVVHQDTEPESWAIELTAVIDWDSVRPGLARFLFDNKGTNVTFRFHDVDAAVSSGSPALTGTCTLVPLPYGGTGNDFATATVQLPIDGDPVPDVTP